MPTHSAIARACAYAAFLLMAAGFVCVSIGAYGVSLLVLLIIVSLMEVRVRLGFRGNRNWIFCLHVLSGALLGVALAAFWYEGVHAYRAQLLFLFALMAATGCFLLVRNLRSIG